VAHLEEYVEADRAAVESFLRHPDGLHLYLLSRLEPPLRGIGFVFRREDRIEGFAWIGTGQNLVLAGEDDEFLRAVADLAAEHERSWLMGVGPWGATTDFLGRYLPKGTRTPRLDRSQGFYVQKPDTLPPLREPTLAAATPADREEVTGAAARMSAEDFEIDLWRIDRDAVRRGVTRRIREGRTWVCRRDGHLAFKVDVELSPPHGGQVEGVYTEESLRGHGIASRCMAELGHRLLDDLPMLTLHVSTANTPALRAYENAGYRRAAELRLAIFPHPRRGVR
jgi:ribosomal protein S18 acetylase RimI-like enzyme